MKKTTGRILVVVVLAALAVLLLWGLPKMLSISNVFLCTNCVGFESQQYGGEWIKKLNSRSIYQSQDCVPDVPNYIYFEKGVWQYGNGSLAPVSGEPPARSWTTYRYDRSVYTDGPGSQNNYIHKPRQHPDCIAAIQEVAQDAGLVTIAPNDSVSIPENPTAPQINYLYVCPDGTITVDAAACVGASTIDAGEYLEDTLGVEKPSLWSKVKAFFARWFS